MTAEGWITIAVVVAIFVGLLRNIAPTDLLFLSAATLLALLGVISAEEAFAGFSNGGMLTVAFMFVVAAGLKETGFLDVVGHGLLGSTATTSGALARLSAAVLPLSAFLNNTPVVSMFLPVVMDWCRKNRVSPSRLLIPLSFLAILGGTCTLIGTSTNLVVTGLMEKSGVPGVSEGLSLFELGKVGVPYAIVGTLYLFLAARFILPDRKEMMEQLGESRREYLAEMLVETGCRLVGQTVESAGLRKLPGLFLIEIEREGKTIGPVGPDQDIRALDRLVFAGIVASIVELERIPGLNPISDPHYEISPRQQRNRKLCEAVISSDSPLVGATVRDADFRSSYDAAVIAVHRSGQRVVSKIGDISLKPGDTLLMQTGPGFLRAHRNDPAFYLVSDVHEWSALRSDRRWFAILIFLMMLVLMTFTSLSTALAATAAAVLMIAFGCLSIEDARRSMEWQVLVSVASAFAISKALENSGAARFVAQSLVDLTTQAGPVWGPWLALAAIYLIASLVTELITNNATAALLFPFCLETGRLYGVSPMPYLIALMLAASASFMTPIGYQTNMMVYGPGGYRFSDFLRVGAPLNLVLWMVAVILIPVFWPFRPA